MDDNDPIQQFFPGEEDVDLYAVLSLTKESANDDAVKKAYRKQALRYHPDKHTNSPQETKEDAYKKFQQIGFAYAVLGDAKRRARYDATGKTDEGFDLGPGEDGWEAYFEDLFDKVTRGRLDEDKKNYQGSAEEVEDLKVAYLETDGSLGDLMTHIPHSTYQDELRFVKIVNGCIKKGELKSTPLWVSSSKDEKARKARKKESEKEAKEAEERAKELGVWDEFYGDGKVGKRLPKGKGKKQDSVDDDGEDVSALQALILKRKKSRESLLDNLAAKYANPSAKSGRGKKRAVDEDEEELAPPRKKSRVANPPPDIDDEEFTKLQAKLFGDKDKKEAAASSTSNKKAKGRKAK